MMQLWKQQIISLIKKQLQKLFDETFDKNNLTLDDEIELLEKKLNALKELKNDKN